jgi:hypothetical protein
MVRQLILSNLTLLGETVARESVGVTVSERCALKLEYCRPSPIQYRSQLQMAGLHFARGHRLLQMLVNDVI